MSILDRLAVFFPFERTVGLRGGHHAPEPSDGGDDSGWTTSVNMENERLESEVTYSLSPC